MRRLTLALVSALVAAPATAAPPTPSGTSMTWSAPANGPGRFVSAHGRKSSVMGYPDAGLEVWAWPLQLLSGYRVRFREPGRIAPLEGRALLSRIETRPTEVVRVYVGPDFVVRERIFTPLDAPGAVLTYEVEGLPDVQVEARFQPSLDLMWPGALGGQSVGWSEARKGYVEREPLQGFTATIRSPQAVAHDPTTNFAAARPDGLGLVMAPALEADGVRRARLVVAQDPDGEAEGAPLSARLDADEPKLREEAQAHYAAVIAGATEIVTPDPELNRALAASVLAQEQAWVCAPQLGCGSVGGYGPSRPGRRPQYAWFFGGDGLTAVEGLLAAGRFERARDELEFIARYQNKTNGMVWHEMSLSAPLIDWQTRYPYMFVHVDITLQYLSTLAAYLDDTGDRLFVKAHWRGIVAGWRYARSLVDPATRLPAIPKGKQGQNEQAVLRDDIRLSTAWIDAADGFARLAKAMGEAKSAQDAERAAAASRDAVRTDGWDAQRGFWLGGHSEDGAPVHEQRPDAARILLQGVFSPEQVDAALDRIAGPNFQTDWGVRSLASDDPGYDPNPYGQGSVWALGTSGVARAFWDAHRPQTAWAAWSGLLPWTTLDSPGRLHEVLAGDLFHPELESTPEQTWSSAAFLTGAVGGLLGLQPHAPDAALTFAPHLPADWSGVGVRRLRVGRAILDLRMTQDAGATTLEVRATGGPVTLDFAPEIPLGARLLGTEVDGAPVEAKAEAHAQDQHARLRTTLRTGVTRIVIRYAGGVRAAPVISAPLPGDASVNLKLASLRWSGGALRLRAYVADAAHASIDLLTPLKIAAVEGGDATPVAPGRIRLTLRPPAARDRPPGGYIPVDAVVSFAPAP